MSRRQRQPCGGHRAGSALPGEPEFLCSSWQEPEARRPHDGIAGPPPSSSIRAGVPFAWLIRGSLQTRRAWWYQGAGSSHPTPPGTTPPIPASGTFVSFVPLGLGLLPPLREEAFLVVTFALKLAVRGQVPRVRLLAVIHLHLQHRMGRKCAPAMALSGVGPPKEGPKSTQKCPEPEPSPTSSSACRYCLAKSSIFFWAAVRL